jgi:hypothetical protein
MLIKLKIKKRKEAKLWENYRRVIKNKMELIKTELIKKSKTWKTGIKTLL